MKILKLVSISVALAAIMPTHSMGDGKVTGKKGMSPTPTYDSVIVMDKETGKILERKWVKRDSTTKVQPGDTVDNFYIDQNTGEISGHQLFIYKKPK